MYNTLVALIALHFTMSNIITRVDNMYINTCTMRLNRSKIVVGYKLQCFRFKSPAPTHPINISCGR